MNLQIRSENPGDKAAIHLLKTAAFEGKRFVNGMEALIIDQLRHDGDLSLSLVVLSSETIVGHVAFSPAWIGDTSKGWFALKPVSILPTRQGQGIG